MYLKRHNMSESSRVTKGWLRVVLIIVPFFIFIGVSQMMAMMVLGIKLTERNFVPNTFQNMVLALSMLLATTTVVAMFREWVDKESFRSLGFKLKNAGKELVVGILLGIVMITSGFVLLIMLKEISWAGTNVDLSSLLLSVVLFLAVAFNEELIFRGYILSNLMRSMNRYVALVVTSVLFSLVHLGNDSFSWFSFLTILLAGLLLGLPYIYTKSLWLPVALHFSWNFFQGTIFGFNVSGIKEYSLITQSRESDTLMNGGAFGFEGSILSVIFLSMATCALWLYHSRKEKSIPASVTREEVPEGGLDTVIVE
jgi:membrane protease YdiL (CAAX protease family)